MDDLTQPWLLPTDPAKACHCLCARWQHRGICTGEAQTWGVMESSLDGVLWIPLCGPCAEDIESQGRSSR